ncbi:hypothetical protein L1987_29803 [Smallanthus sonchifolius]|uniref:Uncharacterized protein n=1 Tax=Smallanthus sonchifolius TaxID=185202 RepID=A0ACB9I2B3_9ASTR|nr:hypothetical protein L1987_29803 [Smallanthus sonchifolius]
MQHALRFHNFCHHDEAQEEYVEVFTHGCSCSDENLRFLISQVLPEVKLGIGGFSMGAACALYFATCFVHGRYGNGTPHTRLTLRLSSD